MSAQYPKKCPAFEALTVRTKKCATTTPKSFLTRFPLVPITHLCDPSPGEGQHSRGGRWVGAPHPLRATGQSDPAKESRTGKFFFKGSWRDLNTFDVQQRRIAFSTPLQGVGVWRGQCCSKPHEKKFEKKLMLPRAWGNGQMHALGNTMFLKYAVFFGRKLKNQKYWQIFWSQEKPLLKWSFFCKSKWFSRRTEKKKVMWKHMPNNTYMPKT